jgi:predicted nucleic acid-binding protein
MSYLLDTCILSKLRRLKKRPDKELEAWFAEKDESLFFVSALTIGEIEAGIHKLDITKEQELNARMALEEWFLEELIPRFHERILHVDGRVALEWGRLYGECQRRGYTIPAIDGLIAATAVVHQLIIVTENVKDFIETGISVFNPCTKPPPPPEITYPALTKRRKGPKRPKGQ